MVKSSRDCATSAGGGRKESTRFVSVKSPIIYALAMSYRQWFRTISGAENGGDGREFGPFNNKE